MAIDFPASPTTGDEFLSEEGHIYKYDGASWETNFSISDLFRYRTIYSRGYVSGGYKSSSPWSNVNKTIHATDITSNLGDILTAAASYKTGGFSDYNHYIYGVTNTHNGNSATVNAIDMATDVNRGTNTSWNMTVSRTDAEALMNPSLTLAYICGGGSGNVDKHNLTTEVMYSTGAISATIGGGTNNGFGAFFGEFYGWLSKGTAVGSNVRLTWSTETWTSDLISWATDGQPKGLSSKHGYGYGSTGSYSGSSTMNKFSDITGGSAVSSYTRPSGNHGEENMQVGQNWGYMIGGYDGATLGQHNVTEKYYYTSDTATTMGTDTQPKGHDGMSSGCCGTASDLLLGT